MIFSPPKCIDFPPNFLLLHVDFCASPYNSCRLDLPDVTTPSDSALNELALRVQRLMKGNVRRKFNKFHSALSAISASVVDRCGDAANISPLLISLPRWTQEYLDNFRQRRENWQDLGAALKAVCAEFPGREIRILLSTCHEHALEAQEALALKLALAPLVPVIVEFPEADRLDQTRVRECLGCELVSHSTVEALVTSQAVAPDRDRISRLHELESGRMAPRNDIVAFNESLHMPSFAWYPVEARRKMSGAVVIVACMKNEGPFLLEWVAYHRSLGIDHFVIYTNDCDDGTDALLDRLSLQGFVTRVENSSFRGQSPQKFALEQALKLEIVREAEWLLHIDADEFINIRTGDGTWADLLEALPAGVTNIAMTWRIFGSAGVRTYTDTPIIGQFRRCAPSYLPKPHINWGFKTATRNIGAYAKLSCHRPNQLDVSQADKVIWVNGSGRLMPTSYHQKGWRSDVKTIGYDLVQLNHYALRSAESFLVKRQRGRALHVDREIGENYWIRMDWNYFSDVSIIRSLDRLKAEVSAIVAADPEVGRFHEISVQSHQEKISELMDTPDFRALYDRVTQLDFDLGQRVLRCLDNDMDS